MAIVQESLANANFQALGMDEVTRDMTLSFSAINTNRLDEVAYTEVAVTSAQIKTLGSIPKVILAAPGAGKYYEYWGVIESTYDTAAYTVTDDIVLGDTDTYAGSYISKLIITESESMVEPFNSTTRGQEVGVIAGTQVGYPFKLNTALKLFTYNATDPITGSGTILVKIWYVLKTMGTEL